MNANLLDKTLVGLHKLLPARLLARFIYRLSRSERPWLKAAVIRGFCALYTVNLAEAERTQPQQYTSFNDFFTRTLKQGARQFAIDPATVISPADGTIAQTGQASDGQLLQAKGINFSAASLLGDPDLALKLADAPFATVYLAPYNYHRVHMPMAGELVQTRFIPGKLYSVNARTTAVIPGLYALNERLVCEFSGPHGPFAVVLVGAMNVASISTAWGGEIRPPVHGEVLQQRYGTGQGNTVHLNQGDYLGHFNMGSTVVVLGPAAACTWDEHLSPGTTVQVGAPMAQLSGTP